MRELGIEQVFAWSPPAKGRVKRVAGTFQDRLVMALCLADVRTLEEANRLLEEYLPRCNERFDVPSIDERSAYRPLPAETDLADVLWLQASVGEPIWPLANGAHPRYTDW